MDAAEKHLAAYERVMKVFEMNNDHYFKRTQILMIVIQSALLLSMGKLLSKISGKYSADMGEIITVLKASPHTALVGLFIGAILSVLGIVGAYAWVRMITRQHQRMELCRTYLRDLESKMCNRLSIPLDYFRKETQAFHDSRNVHFDGTNDFPSGEMSGKIEGGAMNIEKRIAYYLIVLWIFMWTVITFAFWWLAIKHVHWCVALVGISFISSTFVLPIQFFFHAKKDRKRRRECRDCQQSLFHARRHWRWCRECRRVS